MSEALEIWRQRLAHLQREEAIATDSEQKFTLARRIEAAKAKIAELEATPMRQLQDTSAAARSPRQSVISTLVASLATALGIGCLVWGWSRPQSLTADMTAIATDWRIVVGILLLVAGGLILLLSLLLGRSSTKKRELHEGKLTR